MPISSDQFERLDDTPAFEDSTKACRVLEQLTQHRDKAFEQGEIAKMADVPIGGIGVVLRRLEDLGVVEHKCRYWRARPDDRVGSLQSMVISQQSIANHYGDETLAKGELLRHEPDDKE